MELKIYQAFLAVCLFTALSVNAEAVDLVQSRVLVDNIPERIMRLELNPIASHLALVKQYWGNVSIIDLRTSRTIWTHKQHDLSFSNYGLAWSNGGGMVASGGQTPKVFEASSGDLIAELETRSENFSCVAMTFSPDNRWIAGARYDDKNQVVVWNAESGKLVAELPELIFAKEFAYNGAVRIQFAQDGSTLFAAGGGWIAIWSIEHTRLLKVIDLRELLEISPYYSFSGGAFAFTKDLRFAAFNSELDMYILNLSSLKLVRKLTLPFYPRSYEFTDDGEKLHIAALGKGSVEPPQPLEPYQLHFSLLEILTGKIEEKRVSEPFDFLPNEHQSATSSMRVAGFDVRNGTFVLAAGREPQFKNSTLEKFGRHQILGWISE